MSLSHNAIHFHLVLEPQGYFFNPHRPEGLIFNVNNPINARFIMRPRTPETDETGMHGMYCCVNSSYECTDAEYNFVHNLINRKYIPFEADGISLPFILRGEEKINKEGDLKDGYRLPVERFPKSIQHLYDKAIEETSDIAWRILTLLRWNQKSDADIDPFKSAHMYWKTDQEVYHAGGFRRYQSLPSSLAGVEWNEKDVEELAELYNSDAEEPLSHHLLREAVALSHSSPRSALLILATALEVGAKQYISNLAPQTRWIMLKMPSPPVSRLYRDVIPDIHRQLGNDIAFWSNLRPLFKACEKIFEDRNELTHSGVFKPSPETIVEYIQVSSDLLYILDALNGHEWAKSHISPKIRRELGWPEPRYQRYVTSLIIQEG